MSELEGLGKGLSDFVQKEAKKLENESWLFERIEIREKKIFAVYRNPRTGRTTETEFRIQPTKKGGRKR